MPSGRGTGATAAGLVGVSALAWIYLLWIARGAHSMGAAVSTSWSGTEFVLMFTMWWVMMAAMMLPSALPMVLTFGTVNRRQRERGRAHVPSAVFASGYLLAWGAFSLLATVVQWRLNRAAMLLPSMQLASALLGAMLWVGAGVYQWTPLKRACLANCRSPIDFVINRWRDGWWGALRMGGEHGVYCLGCCALLMALLFVGGVMNLRWVAALTIFVLVEKLFPGGEWVARAGGAAMVAFGAFLLVSA